MTKIEQAAEQLLEAVEDFEGYRQDIYTAIADLREALVQQKENTMPITDDHGQATLKQYRVIEQIGNWYLLYDQHQIGNHAHHEFRIQKLKHDIALYPGISLSEAQQRFREKVKEDHE